MIANPQFWRLSIALLLFELEFVVVATTLLERRKGRGVRHRRRHCGLRTGEARRVFLDGVRRIPYHPLAAVGTSLSTNDRLEDRLHETALRQVYVQTRTCAGIAAVAFTRSAI